MSAFYDQASLVMVPSGYKDGKLYSQKPLSTSGELSFSRGSDIEATRVNANGYIEKAQVNLLLQSNTFNTTWLNQLGGTITGGQSGYDGTNDAWLLSKDTSTFRSVRQVISFAGVVTYSAYVKAGTLSNAALRIDSSAGSLQVLYDLSAGTATLSGGANIAYGIDSIGSGWYRIFVTANISGGTNVHVYVDRDGTTAGNIYIQDAQLNYGLVAQTYQETTTAAVVSGITDDMPRLNYDPANPTCPSLLLEPSRQNLFTYTEYINGLLTIQATATENADTSPEGVVNAARLYDNAVNGQHRVGEGIAVTSGTTYTWSVFAKKGTLRYCYLLSTAAASTERYFFDLQEGTAITSGGTIEDYGNGWYRLSAQTTASATGNAVFAFNLTNADQDITYTGTGTDYHIIYGFQCEAGNFVSSYIPSYGSSATRTADDMDTTFASAFATDGGATLFYEIDGAPVTGNNATGAHYAIYFSSNDYITYNRTAGGIHRIRVNANSVANYFQSGVDSTDTVKICASVTASTATVYANGVLVDSVSITGSWASATNLVTTINDTIGSIPVKQLILFPTALTATQLAELTA